MAIVPLPPNQREIITEYYVLTADLGQSNDPTALSVIHHRNHRHIRADGRITQAGETFDVRYLRRLPLGLSYVEVVGEVGRLLSRPPLQLAELAIDETGVGRPVGDLFEDAGFKPTRVTITAGDNQGCVGERRWHVAKSLLVSNLDARMHTGQLRFAADLSEADAMQEELKDFRRKVSVAGRYTFEARVGKHDDLVLSVAIGLWAVVGRPKPPVAAFGVYGTIPDSAMPSHGGTS